MTPLKGLEFKFYKAFGLALAFNFDSTDPDFITIMIGPLLITINRWNYWK